MNTFDYTETIFSLKNLLDFNSKILDHFVFNQCRGIRLPVKLEVNCYNSQIRERHCDKL